MMKKTILSSIIAVIAISACGGGGGGSSSPPPPLYLPAGNYSVISIATGTNVTNAIVCSAVLDPIILLFSSASATSNGTGQVTINQNFENITFDMNINASPCASWQSQGVTYTMTNCSYSAQNNSMSGNMNASNFSRDFSKLGCGLQTTFKGL